MYNKPNTECEECFKIRTCYFKNGQMLCESCLHRLNIRSRKMYEGIGAKR